MVFKKCHVYKIRCSYITPPHNKISICICPSTAKFLWINSNPRKTRKLSQVFLGEQDLSFLAHNSYVDAGRIFTFQPFDLFTAKHVCILTKDVAKKIKKVAQASPDLPKGHIELIINCIDSVFPN